MAQSRPEVPEGLRRHELDPPREDGGHGLQGTAVLHRQPSGTPQSGSFQFQSRETHMAAGMRGSSVTALCVHYVNKKQ